MIVNLRDHQEQCNELMQRIIAAGGSALDVDRERAAELARLADEQIKRMNADYLEALRNIEREFLRLVN